MPTSRQSGEEPSRVRQRRPTTRAAMMRRRPTRPDSTPSTTRRRPTRPDSTPSTTRRRPTRPDSTPSTTRRLVSDAAAPRLIDGSLERAALSNTSEGALARCVGDVDRFFSETWGKAPLLQRRRESNGFDDLLTLKDIDFILTTSWLRTPAFRLVQDGKPLDERSYTKWAGVGARGAHDTVDPGKVYSLFHAGATVVLQAMQRYWVPLARFIGDLEVMLTLPAQANAYITPPGSRGLAVHYDTHDVFVLQVSGRKTWQIYDPVIESPLPSQGSIEGETTAPVLET